MATRLSRANRWLHRLLILSLLGLGNPVAAQLRGKSAYRSPRATVALDFLTKLEAGQTLEAHRLLTASARRAYPASALKAPRRTSPFRRVMFEGPVSQFEALQKAPGKYYIVCIVDAPKGSGATTHIAVTVMVEPADSQWRVADYRYDSRQHPACATRV